MGLQALLKVLKQQKKKHRKTTVKNNYLLVLLQLIDLKVHKLSL